jgi:hypothetical protein
MNSLGIIDVFFFLTVLRTVSPQKRKGDFLQYSDTKTACYSLFDDVLEKLQYGIGTSVLIYIYLGNVMIILSFMEIPMNCEVGRGILKDQTCKSPKVLCNTEKLK